MFEVLFPVSGVETNIFLPLFVAFSISFFTSMSGVSGAFLLLPFQMSFLGYTSPSVSATNLVYNIVAIPSGVYRYIKEKRMAWPLTWVIICGTLPGVLIGYYVRVLYLPDPRAFKLFVGCVLFYISFRLLSDVLKKTAKKTDIIDEKFKNMAKQDSKGAGSGFSSGIPSSAVVNTISISLTKTEYEFWGERFSFNTAGVLLFSLFVGIIGGTYGIGGGAIIAPFLVTFFHLPVYTIAGATLMGTLITSVSGVIFYSLIPAASGLTKSPDWLLGFLFGAGGFAGMYCGARCQKFVPQKLIKLLLGLLIVFVAIKYIYQYF
ncbi:MAG: sulfite exporter TauE/SafE family protein [Nitrospiraceae bacterium]|nr:MAG: sulfite exporter TauE/SafE family protein [Nitrospiraceae bacterium]